MSNVTYALSGLLAVALLIGLPLLIHILIDALALYHAAAMARVRNHTRRTNA